MWIAISDGLARLMKFSLHPKFNMGEEVRVKTDLKSGSWEKPELKLERFVVTNIYERYDKYEGKHHYRYVLKSPNVMTTLSEKFLIRY